MGITVTLDINTAVTEELANVIGDIPLEVEAVSRELVAIVEPQILSDLESYPPETSFPVGSFPWASEKQRRKVLSLLRAQAIARGDFTIGPRGGIVVTNLKYQRTFDFQRSCIIEFDQQGGRFNIAVSSTFPASQYVVGSGDIARSPKPQQPFHKNRWYVFTKVLQFYGDFVAAEFGRQMDDIFSQQIEQAVKRTAK
jgi:hypothetical protein